MRLPVEPLLRVSGCVEASIGSAWIGKGSPDSVLACRLGYSSVAEMARSLNWYRAKREGLTWTRADQLAVALGYHPLEIWGSDWLLAQELTPTQGVRLKPVRKEPRWALVRAEMGAA